MQAPAIPPSEKERLEALRAYRILDTEPELAFERLTALTANLFDVPIALISLVDEARQWFKSAHGLNAVQSPRDLSFCGHAILSDQPFVVPNALEDVRFADNPFVTGDPDVRFYAGAPLITPQGHHIGTLCIIDQRPRRLTPLQEMVLADLARLAIDQLELRLARFELQQESNELQSLLSGFPMAMLVMADGEFRFANAAADRLFGYPPGELVGMKHVDLIHPEERDASLKVARQGLGDPSSRAVYRRMLKKNGEVVTVDGSMSRLTWGGRRAVTVALRDITEEIRLRDLREQLSQQTEEQLGLMLAVFDVLPDGIVLFDPEFRCVYANQAMGDILGVKSESIKGWTPEDAARHVASMATDPAQVMLSAPNLRKLNRNAASATVFHLNKPRPRVMRRTLHTLNSPTHPFLSVWNDITHEAEQLALSEEQASTDTLTLLPNRRMLEQKLARAAKSGGLMSIALFDVDHFKRVNDEHGHPVGDEVLRMVAAALFRTARDGDLVGRWGGEEFMAVLRSDLHGAEKFAERARDAVAALKTPAGPVTVSAGVAQNQNGVDVFKVADAKLYEAKRAGRNRVCS